MQLLYTKQSLSICPSNIPLLIKLCFEVNNKLSIRATWTLELLCKHSLTLILPHLDSFFQKLENVKLDSAKRPCAKICELIALD